MVSGARTGNLSLPHSEEPLEFSLALGGPLYWLWRRTRIAGERLDLLPRRVTVLVLLAWFPLLVLSLAEGHAWGGVKLPFLQDIGVHTRFLLALPLLIVAEPIVNERVRLAVAQFTARGLIPDAARSQFNAGVASAMRLRDSVFVEIALVALIYGVVAMSLREHVPLEKLLDAVGPGTTTTNWYERAAVDGKSQLTLAGYWMAFVSLPLFQLLLLRWYFRIFVLARFLWSTSRIKLQLMPLNPDRCGGLGFLASVGQCFDPFLLAQGTVIAGVIATNILFEGATLPQFKLVLIGLVSAMVFIILGPLLVFIVQLVRAKRAGLREYGRLAQRYAGDFERKWLRGPTPDDEQLLGSADIQSLADLGNGFAFVNEMRWVPFSIRHVIELAVVTLLPVAPLLLTIVPLEDLLDKLLKMMFFG